ncbi:MAG: GNAT family N-acetyltransferase [Sphingomicrobium sp.]
MFARTPRLLLRPAWAEDASTLASAIADEMICRNLSAAPWPYSVRDAEAWIAEPRDPVLPSLLVFERTSSVPRLVGGCGLTRRPSGAVELEYWVARTDWNRGIATEAATAVLDMARSLRIRQIEASHYVDSPASARVLEKLGFSSTGLTEIPTGRAEGRNAAIQLTRARLADRQVKVERVPQPIAA